MTDQTIPADKVREIIARWRDGVSDRGGLILDDLKALLPAPPRPTLANMTPSNRAACQWMQADVGVERRIIVRVMDVEEGAVTLVESGDTVVCPHSSVTPRPDLPRMEWPADAVPESTLAVGSEWNDADALTRACEESGRDQITVTDRDGDAYVWDANLHDWRDLHPIPNYAPYTIIHAGKKADQ